MGKSMRVWVGFILSILALVLQIIGFATPYWMYQKLYLFNAHSGLWQYCISTTGCEQIGTGNCDSPGCHRFYAVRAMESLAFICFSTSCMMAAFHIFLNTQNRAQTKRVGAVMSILGAIMGMIGVIIYATLDGMEASDLHFSFAFCVIAAAAGLVSGLLMINVDRNEETIGLLSN